MNEDSYGSTIRERMKESMAEPAGAPVNRQWGWKEWVGTVLWSVVVLAAFTGLLWVYVLSRTPRHV